MAVWMVLSSTKRKEKKSIFFYFFWFFAMMTSFLGYFEVDFGLIFGRLLCHVYGPFGVSIREGLSSVERVVSEMSLGQKTACTGTPKVPRAHNYIGSMLLRRSQLGIRA